MTTSLKAFEGAVSVKTDEDQPRLFTTPEELPKTEKEFKQAYNMQRITTRNTVQYVIAHNLLSCLTLSKIKENATVRAMLRKTNCFIRYNCWNSKTLDVASPGSIMKIHPTNYYTKTLETKIQNVISKIKCK